MTRGETVPSYRGVRNMKGKGGTWQVGEELESEGDSVISPPTITPCPLHKLC